MAIKLFVLLFVVGFSVLQLRLLNIPGFIFPGNITPVRKLIDVSAITFPSLTGSASRMVNAPVAANNQFPYAISLQQISQLPNRLLAHRCGGAMITLQHALTIASCTYNVVNDVQQILNASEYRVFAGATTLLSDTANHIRNIANFTLHPDHIGYPSSVNDIAIITTTEPFPNTTVYPIPLPTAEFYPTDWTLCNVAGWGANASTAVASENLRYALKYIYNNVTCTNIYNPLPAYANILPAMICAASYDTMTAGCFGDQGNGLTCNGQLTGLLFLMNDCSTELSYPEVYTRVSHYVPWIISITGAASTFKPDFIVLALVSVICIKIFN